LTLLIVYIFGRDTGRGFQALKPGVIFFLIAILIFSPLLLRNFIWKGNPFYPVWGWALADSGFHLTPLSTLEMRTVLYHESLPQILLIPLRMFFEGKDGSPKNFDGVLNPFFLLFLIAGLINLKKYYDIKFLSLFSLLFFYITFFTVDFATRYILPILPCLIIIMVYGIKSLMEKRLLKILSTVVIILLFSFNASYLLNLYERYKPFPYLTGKESRKEYLSKTLPDYPAIEFVNKNLPSDAKLQLIFTGDRGYYFDREYYYRDRMGSDIVGMVRDSRSEEDLKLKFKSEGITHLFIRESLFINFCNNNFEGRDYKLIHNFFLDHLERLYIKNDFAVYRIK
jgi:hypothetical protein